MQNFGVPKDLDFKIVALIHLSAIICICDLDQLEL